MSVEASGGAFRALAAKADAGQLFLDPSAAKKAADACEARINWLLGFKRGGHRLAYTSSFGNFGSAQALGKKFEDLATGGAGSGSFEDIVQGHIDAVKAMKDAFEKAGAAYNSADEATRDAIDKAGRGRD